MDFYPELGQAIDLLLGSQKYLQIPGEPFCWRKSKACPTQNPASTSCASPAPSAVWMGGWASLLKAVLPFCPSCHVATQQLWQAHSISPLSCLKKAFDKLLGQLVIHQYSHQCAICPGQVQGHITILLRRALHFLGVWVREVQAEGLYRNISAIFFHQHPSHCHKTIPYHKSELTLLCGWYASLVNHIQCNILFKYDLLWSRENWHLQNFCNLIYCVISITFCITSYILPDLQPILNYMNIKLLMQFHLPARRMIPFLYFLFSQQGMKVSRTCKWWS